MKNKYITYVIWDSTKLDELLNKIEEPFEIVGYSATTGTGTVPSLWVTIKIKK